MYIYITLFHHMVAQKFKKTIQIHQVTMRKKIKKMLTFNIYGITIDRDNCLRQHNH